MKAIIKLILYKKSTPNIDKRWHTIQNMVDENGVVQYPNRQQFDDNNNQYLQQIQTRQSSFGLSSVWKCIGPFDFDKDANGRSYAQRRTCTPSKKVRAILTF